MSPRAPCVLTPYIDVLGYERFGAPRCLHLQGENLVSRISIIRDVAVKLPE